MIKNCHKFKNIGNVKKIEIIHENEKKSIPKHYNRKTSYVDFGNYYQPLSFEIIDFLNSEIRIKKNHEYNNKKQWMIDFVTATDISNFTFCPVSYSISKSLEHDFLLESTEIGLVEHKESIVKSFFKSKKFKKEFFEDTTGISNRTKIYKELFEILDKSEVIYNGHEINNDVKYFKSKNGRYVGQPDFILRKIDTNEFFVIEEKFQYTPREFVNHSNRQDKDFENKKNEIDKKRNSDFFYENHINQVYSYIYGIAEYSISFGILIYWKYEIIDEKLEVHSCKIKIIEKNSSKRNELNTIYKDINQFCKTGLFNFSPTTRNPSKCASCVNNFLCGHKTGNFTEINIPYNKNHLKIYNTDYPEELKKSDDTKFNNSEEFDIDNFINNNISYPREILDDSNEEEDDEEIDE